MANPVLVEVLRGGVVESRHRGTVAIVDADGKAVETIGDVEAPVFPRSAVKAIQALPLLESGAADAYGFGDREIALACASHSGEPEHVALARSMLERAGLAGEALECGTHWPSRQEAMLDMARRNDRPTALHNNCSGKHAGFICTCAHQGLDHHGYIRPGHSSQQLIRQALEEVTGAAHDAAHRGTDGCSIPTYAVPLTNLALGFARMASGAGLPPERARTARRIFAACMAEPFYVAGTERFDTRLMRLGAGRIFSKTGAEGVYCAAIPELGLGIALKCDDGGTRGAETMVASILARLLAADEHLSTELTGLANQTLTNWNGIEIGRVRPTAPLG